MVDGLHRVSSAQHIESSYVDDFGGSLAQPSISLLPLELIRRRQGYESAEKAVALITAVAIGFRYDIFFDFHVGALLAVVSLPLWLRSLSRFRFATPILLLMVVATASGLLLTLMNSSDHDVIPSTLASRVSIVVGLALCTGALLWARSLVGAKATALAFSVGLVASVPFSSSITDNPWRFTYSIPITVLVLSIAWYIGRWWADVICLVGLALIGVVSDSRSNSAILFLTAVIILWQAISRTMFGRRRRAPVSIVGLALLGVGVYFVAQAAILEGYFGQATEARSVAQVDQSGSLLLGGRPEAAASLALINRYPWGLGSGIKATLPDVLSAKTAMSSIGYDPNNGYVERFMFGTGVEVHSVLGDLWIWLGLAGMLLAVGIAATVLYGLRVQLQASALSGLMAFLALRYLWDLAFSPVATAVTLLPLTIALAVVALPPRGSPTKFTSARRSPS